MLSILHFYTIFEYLHNQLPAVLIVLNKKNFYWYCFSLFFHKHIPFVSPMISSDNYTLYSLSLIVIQCHVQKNNINYNNCYSKFEH